MKNFLLMLALFLMQSCGTTPEPICQKNAAKEGNTLNVRLEAAPNNLNPYLTNVSYSLQVCSAIFNTLGLQDPQTLEMKPALVTAIPKPVTVVDGPHKGDIQYNFEIHQTAVWDNGSPVTGHDVLFTLKPIFIPGLLTGNWATYYDQLKAVEIDVANPKKFTVYFKKYYILALESLCSMPILPAYQYDAESKLANISIEDLVNKRVTDNPNVKAFIEFFKQPRFTNDPAAISGSGAYKLTSLGDQGAVVEKKQNWWGDALVAQYPLLGAYPSKIVYKAVKDEATALRMIREGSLDIAVGLPANVFMELKKDSTIDDCFDFVAFGSSQYSRMLLNHRKPELAEQVVRQALAQVIDYDDIIQKIQQNMAERLVGPIMPFKAYCNKDLTPYKYDVEKAKNMLEAAGWKDTNNNGSRDKMVNGQLVELELEVKFPGSSQTNVLVLDQVEEGATQAGIKIVRNSMDINKITEDTKNGNYEVAITGAGIFAGLDELYPRYHSLSMAPTNGDNRSGFINKETDALLVSIRETADEAKRNEMYKQIQTLLYNQLPEIYLYAPKSRIVVSKRFNYVVSAQRPGYLEMLFKINNPQ